MTWYEDSQFGEYYAEDIPSLDRSEQLSNILFGDQGAGYIDKHAEDLFIQSVFEGRKGAYYDLVDYVWDRYGIDFEDAFDFEDFKQWYDGAKS